MLHVTFKNTKKKILVENVEDIFPKLKDVFEISLDGHYLYLFDKDCEDWVTVKKPDDIAQLCGKGKLLIKKKGKKYCREHVFQARTFSGWAKKPVLKSCKPSVVVLTL